ncbi:MULTISPECIES: toprim domain-containing protein [unclassified Bradyrhizobium]|uniref:toprim domain-containing protein n=1 Tax=unclassified Bradyrhizobium TaxID=2631580 RepID=UPI0033938EFD
MQRQGVLEFAAVLGLGAPNRTSTATWVHYRCPFAKWRHDHGKTKPDHFNVSVPENKHSVYRCWSCKSHGTLAQLAYELGHLRGLDYTAIGKEIEKQELLGPKLYLPKWDDEIKEEWDAGTAKAPIVWPQAHTEFEFYSGAWHPYLRGRNIGVGTAARLGVRYDPFQRRVLFPVYNDAGRFAGFTGRKVEGPAYSNEDGKFEKDGSEFLPVRDYFGLRKSEFFLGEMGLGSGYRSNSRGVLVPRRDTGRVVLHEGIFDYAYACELGAPSPLAILGSELTPTKIQKLKRWGRPTVLFLDNDGPGHAATEKAIHYLFGHIPLLGIEYPDGYEGADPASIPPRVYYAMLEDAKLITRRA